MTKKKGDYEHTKIMSTASLKSLPTTIGNAAYHAALVGGLAIALGKVGHMIMKNIPPPQLEKVNSGTAFAVVCIGAALLTKDFLVTSGIIPGVLLK